MHIAHRLAIYAVADKVHQHTHKNYNLLLQAKHACSMLMVDYHAILNVTH